MIKERLKKLNAIYRQCSTLITKYERNVVGRTTRPNIQWSSRDRKRVLEMAADIGAGVDNIQSLIALAAETSIGGAVQDEFEGPLTGTHIARLRDLAEAACQKLQDIIDAGGEVPR